VGASVSPGRWRKTVKMSTTERLLVPEESGLKDRRVTKPSRQDVSLGADGSVDSNDPSRGEIGKVVLNCGRGRGVGEPMNESASTVEISEEGVCDCV
jgi:hypothetical protein